MAPRALPPPYLNPLIGLAPARQNADITGMEATIAPDVALARTVNQVAAEPKTALRVASIVSALSRALDLSTGQPVGHSVRSCILGMRIANELGLSEETLSDLYYALLLKDCGCSSNSSKTFHALAADDLKAKRDVKTTDWTRFSWETLQYAFSHVGAGKPFLERSQALFRLALTQKAHTRDVTKIRCERGRALAQLMGLSDATGGAILHLDEHWDGKGQPEGLRRTEISLLARAMLLAQTLEVFFTEQGETAALAVAKKRSRTWFDPEMVRAACSAATRGTLFEGLAGENVFSRVLDFDAQAKTLSRDDDTLDAICVAFSQIVDAKSPFTFNHSKGVANASVAIARRLDLSRERILFVRHAALLHDLGKLGISNAILEKPAKLDEAEFQAIRLHPYYTWETLHAIPGLEELTEVAASHHEKLNGKGYHRGLSAEHLSVESRIIAVADIFDALSAKRPYRDSLPLEKVFEIMRKDTPHAIDSACLSALEESGIASDQSFVDLHNLNHQLSSYQY